MPTTTFFLVRHGHTDEVGKLLCGTMPGFHLSPEGRVQAQTAADHLALVPLASVTSSPLERTRETAQAIASRQGLSAQESAAFTEIEFGEWTGSSFSALASSGHWQQFNAARSVTRPPNGELMIEVQERAVGALLDLRQRHPNQAIAIVSHADVIRAVLTFFLGMPIDLFSRLEISPARISIVEIGDDGLVVRQVNGETAAVPGRS